MNYDRQKYIASSIVLDKHDHAIIRSNKLNMSQIVRYMIRNYIKKRGLK